MKLEVDYQIGEDFKEKVGLHFASSHGRADHTLSYRSFLVRWTTLQAKRWSTSPWTKMMTSRTWIAMMTTMTPRRCAHASTGIYIILMSYDRILTLTNLLLGAVARAVATTLLRPPPLQVLMPASVSSSDCPSSFPLFHPGRTRKRTCLLVTLYPLYGPFGFHSRAVLGSRRSCTSCCRGYCNDLEIVRNNRQTGAADLKWSVLNVFLFG